MMQKSTKLMMVKIPLFIHCQWQYIITAVFNSCECTGVNGEALHSLLKAVFFSRKIPSDGSTSRALGLKGS